MGGGKGRGSGVLMFQHFSGDGYVQMDVDGEFEVDCGTAEKGGKVGFCIRKISVS